VWLAAHPDLTVQELAAYLELIHAFEARVRSGEVPDWETYEAANYGYPTYEQQAYGYAETVQFIKDAAVYLRLVCGELGLPVEAPQVR